MTDRFCVVPAAYVVLRRGDLGEQLLLQLREGTGYMDGHWATAAAGHVEAGESVLQAACREATEELGIPIAAADLIPLTAMHRTQRNGRPIDERVDFMLAERNLHHAVVRQLGELRVVADSDGLSRGESANQRSRRLPALG